MKHNLRILANMSRIFILPAMALATCVSSVQAADPIPNPDPDHIINDVAFDYVYRPTVLPENATPAWIKVGGLTSSIESTGPGGSNVLRMANASPGSIYNFTDPLWNPGTTEIATTIEFSMKVISKTTGKDNVTAVVFNGGSGSRVGGFFFDTNSISSLTGGASPIVFDTTSDFVTYRITFTFGVISLYANNSDEALFTVGAGTGTANQIYFGTPGGVTGGVTEWEYMAFTNGWALKPGETNIPESSTIGLVLGALACVAVVAVRRRRLRAA